MRFLEKDRMRGKGAFAESASIAIALAPVFIGVEQNSVPMAVQTADKTNLARDTIEFAWLAALGRG